MSASKKNSIIPTATALLFASLCACGQDTVAPVAPKPPQLAAAKTVFISNATAGWGTERTASDWQYDQFYGAIERTHRFTIVSDPEKADLILEELSTSGTGGCQFCGLLITVRLIDGRSHVILWSVASANDRTGPKPNLAAIADVVREIQSVCGQSQTVK